MPGAFSCSSAEPPSGAFAEGEAFLAERRRKGGTLYRGHGVASRGGSASIASRRERERPIAPRAAATWTGEGEQRGHAESGTPKRSPCLKAEGYPGRGQPSKSRRAAHLLSRR